MPAMRTAQILTLTIGVADGPPLFFLHNARKTCGLQQHFQCHYLRQFYTSSEVLVTLISMTCGLRSLSQDHVRPEWRFEARFVSEWLQFCPLSSQNVMMIISQANVGSPGANSVSDLSVKFRSY